MTDSLSPVDERKRVAEGLKAVIVGRVARDQLQAMRNGYGRDHRVTTRSPIAAPGLAITMDEE